MSEPLPVVYLARHGETGKSLSGQHTGRTDFPLTERGERNARSLGERLRGLTFAQVFTSPMVRATRLRTALLRNRLDGSSSLPLVGEGENSWRFGISSRTKLLITLTRWCRFIGRAGPRGPMNRRQVARSDRQSCPPG
jgi:bisphosphoglycerate-dependent phosphoglycerate mutase